MIKVYPQRSPVYVATKRISNKRRDDYNEEFPGKGEVVLQDRFIHSRPLFSYEQLKKKPADTYLPPKNSKPDIILPSLPPTPVPDDSNNNENNNQLQPPQPSYNSPYDSYNPPDLPPYFYSKPNPSMDEKDNFPPYMQHKPNEENKMKKEKLKPDMELPAPYPLYDSAHSSYNPPNLPPSSHNFDKEPEYPPYADHKPKDNEKENKPEKESTMKEAPYLEYNPYSNHHNNHNHDMKKPDKMPPSLPEYLDYNPYEHKHNQHKIPPKMSPSNHNSDEEPDYPAYTDHKPKDKEKEKKPDEQSTTKEAPYLEYNNFNNAHHNHNYDMKKPDKMPPSLPEYLDYNPHEHKYKMPPYLEYNPHDHHHNHGDDSPNFDHNHDSSDGSDNNDGDNNNSMRKPEMSNDMKLNNSEMHHQFPAYLYHPPPPMDDMKNGENLPPGVPPYLEFNPYDHKGHEKGPPITPTVEPPGPDNSDFHLSDHHPYGKIPPYLDHDPHHFPDFYHYGGPHIYHEIKPLTTTPAPEKERVNKRPYTYYYIGRKLWYIPLYFSLYFIVYVFVLILKSIARHKIVFNQYFEQNREMKSEETMEHLTEHVLTGIEHAAEKYVD